MLIQGRFLKVWRVQNGVIFGVSEVLETMLHSEPFGWRECNRHRGDRIRIQSVEIQKRRDR
jgi:hypothetical protein